LSDLVYICRYKTGAMLRICLLFEHKGYRPGREFHFQILQYILRAAEEDIRQKRRDFTLCLPILFYTGKQPWSPGSLRRLFKKHPAEMHAYLPDFQFETVNLQRLTDAEVLAMRDFFRLRSVFLAMKHAWESDFYRAHFDEIIRFVLENDEAETDAMLFELTIFYMQQVSEIKKEEISELARKASARTRRRIKSGWDMMIEEAETKGIEQGIEQGMATAMKNLMLKRPDYTDADVSDLLDVPMELVKKVRAELKNGSKTEAAAPKRRSKKKE
ncbi:MAG: Rpn family recombination-promoting nuclease/putative transposase, partial [Saprospiraceae bacterium]